MDAIRCVRCNAELAEIVLEGQRASACPQGHGAWLDEAALAHVVEDASDDASPQAEAAAWSASDADPAALTTERFRSCPVCGNTMKKDVFQYGSGVVVDVCGEHGVWVDAGEIEQIEAWSEAWQAHAG